MKRVCAFPFIFFLIFTIFATPTFALSTVISSARLTDDNQTTRMVFSLSGEPHYKLFTLENPQRLVIDIDDAKAISTVQHVDLGHSIVKTIRIGKRGTNDLRIVLDLKENVTPKSFILKSDQNVKPRLVVDLVRKNANQISLSNPQMAALQNREAVLEASKKIEKTLQVANEKVAAVKEDKSFAADSKNVDQVVQMDFPKAKHGAWGRSYDYSQDENASSAEIPYIQSTHDVVVVIDPGHGGKDPGASGLHRTHEKYVVLEISNKLKNILNRKRGFHAVLTRSSDYYISLRERLRIARKDKADLFIAIHADAYKNHDSHGASVYALSERGATSEAARWLAEKENYSELGGVRDFSDKSWLVRSVLLDLSQTATITQSVQIANLFLGNLNHVTVLHHNKVEQARFVVLKSPDIPSLLVETGFISNQYEERRLSDPSYQNKLAQAIANGIVTYFKVHPLRATEIAEIPVRSQPQSQLDSAQAIVYRVKKGDSLSRIATHYGVAMKKLQHYNHLASGQVNVGQTLRIPQNG